MQLSTLLQGVPVSKMYQTLYGKMVVTHEIEVAHVRYDSRKVERGDMFVAIPGNVIDGNRFLQRAIAQGAKVVVTNNNEAIDDYFCMHNGVVKIVVPDTRVALARLSANYYKHPADRLAIVGVTGTNGKTTTAFIVKALLEASAPAGLIGTIEYAIGNKRLPATHTTPESLELQELFSTMVDHGCKAAVMEVSSHALHQHRVEGIPFRVGVFTNLTQDHLDYHPSMDEYFAAKKILFDSLHPDATAVMNIDDAWGQNLASSVMSRKITYGLDAAADIRATGIALSFQRTTFVIGYKNTSIDISAPLVGRFNVSNLLAAFSAGYAMGLSPELMRERFSILSPVPGRFEQIQAPAGWTAVVDYAHTPDALEKALKTIRDLLGTGRKGKILTVFGCGGNRDSGKRPLMGKIASTLSDKVIVTSDNPRHENPETIIDDIVAGIPPGCDMTRIPDRTEAIHQALSVAGKNDIVLIAGKGHEDYQIIGDKKYPFSDQRIVQEFISTHS